MVKKVENLVDDLARLKLVQKLVAEQIELSMMLLKQRLLIVLSLNLLLTTWNMKKN